MPGDGRGQPETEQDHADLDDDEGRGHDAVAGHAEQPGGEGGDGTVREHGGRDAERVDAAAPQDRAAVARAGVGRHRDRQPHAADRLPSTRAAGPCEL